MSERERIMGKGNEGKSLSSSTLVDCDVGLGLKMQLQPPDSYSPSCDGGGGGVGGGGPTFFSNQQVGCFGGSIYDAANRSFIHTTAFRGEGMPASGKALFTASQWQELERQKIIHKYIMASVPVPPELLLPTCRPPSLSQYNTSPGLDLRFSSNGSDPEPWRCKRTDGKKWRCSRDVAPDQKYCERHAHKSRPRSRKHVEAVTTSSHNTTTYSNSPQPLILPASQKSASQLPTMASPNTSYDQTRCIEWFMRRETIPVSTSIKQQQWQQQTMHHNIPSPRLDLERDISDQNNKNNNNVSEYYHPQFEDKQQGFILGPNPFLPDPILDPKLSERTHETRHFIDAWEKEGCLLSASPLRKKISPPSSSSSLSLSMSGGLERESDNGDLRPSQWMMNTWMNMNSPPGGPLGEALCLGNAKTTRGGSSLGSSPHNSSCGKSSCEDGSHAFNFIG